jgi:hypothetical protein
MEKVKIKSIKKLNKKNDRYDLTINSTNNFFANGILIHNTSQRTGNVIVKKKISKWKQIIFSLFGEKIKETTEYQTWLGSRRVVLGEKGKDTGYHTDEMRIKAAEPFFDNLRKGETIFYEIVGFEPNGRSIMGSVSNKKFGDKKFQKEFIKKYGEETTYSYGNKVGDFTILIYRITMTNEDGISVDLTWDDMVRRANELGVKTVPLLEIFYYNDENDKEALIEKVNHLVEGESTLDSKHIREGVCVRTDNSVLNLLILKHKSDTFKILESVIKDSGEIDIEEAS